MSKFILLFLIGLTGFQSSVSAQKQEEYEYKGQVKKFQKVQKIGTVLGITGAATTAGGMVVLASAFSGSDPDSYNTTPLLLGLGGAVMIIGGTCTGVTGLILYSVGVKKEKYFRKKLDNLSVGIIYTPRQKGFSVCYKF
jgi:hypothetical protein